MILGPMYHSGSPQDHRTGRLGAATRRFLNLAMGISAVVNFVVMVRLLLK